MRKINGLVFHHSATSPPDSSDGQRLYEMSTDPAHLKNRGILSKAEYHYIIARNGRLIKCADDMALIGHCGSVRNYDTIGICCEGNLLIQHLTQAQYSTLRMLASMLVRQYGINTSQLLMHKNVMATACPGLNFPHEQLVLDVKSVIGRKPEKMVFKIGSRDVRLIFADSPGFQVNKVMDSPCRIVGGKAAISERSAEMFGLPECALRSLEADGFGVIYVKATREVAVSRRENGR